MTKLTLFMLPLALPLLMNCGGGGDENSNADAVVTPPIESVTEDRGNTTTLLKDNPNSQVILVKVFDNYSIDIDMTEIKMQGEFLFLKIIDQHKKPLFLGQVLHHNSIKIPLAIVADSFPLIVEFYSELKDDKTISYEVYYD